MRKFAGLSLAMVMCIAAVTGYGLAGKANGASMSHDANNDAEMFKSMDSSLAAKLRDYLEIIDRIQKVSDAEGKTEPSRHTSVLSGEKAVSPQAKPRVYKKTVAVAAKLPPPWWHDFEVNMVVYSSKSRTAVVNGKFLREGDLVRPGIIVKQIDSKSVTLERKDSAGAMATDQQENLKTLFVKPGKG